MPPLRLPALGALVVFHVLLVAGARDFWILALGILGWNLLPVLAAVVAMVVVFALGASRSRSDIRPVNAERINAEGLITEHVDRLHDVHVRAQDIHVSISGRRARAAGRLVRPVERQACEHAIDRDAEFDMAIAGDIQIGFAVHGWGQIEGDRRLPRNNRWNFERLDVAVRVGDGPDLCDRHRGGALLREGGGRRASSSELSSSRSHFAQV